MTETCIIMGKGILNTVERFKHETMFIFTTLLSLKTFRLPFQRCAFKLIFVLGKKMRSSKNSVLWTGLVVMRDRG
jgi:hypothetical protein